MQGRARAAKTITITEGPPKVETVIVIVLVSTSGTKILRLPGLPLDIVFGGGGRGDGSRASAPGRRLRRNSFGPTFAKKNDPSRDSSWCGQYVVQGLRGGKQTINLSQTRKSPPEAGFGV